MIETLKRVEWTRCITVLMLASVFSFGIYDGYVPPGMTAFSLVHVFYSVLFGVMLALLIGAFIFSETIAAAAKYKSDNSIFSRFAAPIAMLSLMGYFFFWAFTAKTKYNMYLAYPHISLIVLFVIVVLCVIACYKTFFYVHLDQGQKMTYCGNIVYGKAGFFLEPWFQHELGEIPETLSVSTATSLKFSDVKIESMTLLANVSLSIFNPKTSEYNTCVMTALVEHEIRTYINVQVESMGVAEFLANGKRLPPVDFSIAGFAINWDGDMQEATFK